MTTQQYKLPEDLEAKAKVLYFKLTQGQLKPEDLTQDEKILINRWVIYTLPPERREQLGLVSPEEFDRMYPPPWAPKRGAGRAFLEGALQELTLGLIKPQTEPQTTAEKVARFAGQAVGTLPWFIPGMPFMRAGGLLATRLLPALLRRELAPITASVVREAGAAAAHYLARQKARGEPVTIEGLLEHAGTAALGARLILPRATAGHIAGTLARRLKAETDEFVKAGVQPDEALKQATERVANQVRELAEGIRTGRYGEREVSQLLGTSIKWTFVKPEDFARYLEELADKGIEAVPKVLIPKHGVGPGARPPYAAQVAEVLRRAKEPPVVTTQAAQQAAAAQAQRTITPEMEALAAQLGIDPVTLKPIEGAAKKAARTRGARQAPKSAPAQAAQPTATEADYFQALLRELGLTEEAAQAAKPRRTAPKPKQKTTPTQPTAPEQTQQPTPAPTTPPQPGTAKKPRPQPTKQTTTVVKTGKLAKKAEVDKQAAELQNLGYTTTKKLGDIEVQDKITVTVPGGEQLRNVFVERIWKKPRGPAYVLLAQYNDKTGSRTYYLYNINQLKIAEP